MSNLVLHIGRHKSGTSSLQRFFCDNERNLEQSGWTYPSELRTPIAHHSLATYYNERQFKKLSRKESNQLAENVSIFWTEANRHRKILISSENFQNISDPLHLANDLKAFDIQIVIYLREATSYLLSAYAQAVKARKVTLSLADYEKWIFKANYREFIERWSARFPNADIVVRPYSRDLLECRDVRQDFLKHTWLRRDIDTSTMEFRMDDRNPSIAGDLLEFKRRINNTPFETVISTAKLYKILQEIAINESSYRTNQGVPKKLKQELIKKYQAEAEWVEKQYELPAGCLLNRDYPVSQDREESSFNFDAIATQLNNVNANLGDRLLELLSSRQKNRILRRVRDLLSL